jgi:succinyl-CoA synthetase beta subunit
MPSCAPKKAKTAAGELDGPLWVVKAQIHAGGRGKGHFKEADAGEKGGVRLAKSVEEAEAEAKKMLGRTLVTHQTGPAGKVVNRIYIEDGSGIERELYLALLVDRQSSRISFVCSTEGGMDIEEVAASTPEKILSFSRRSRHRLPAVPRPPHRLRPRARGQAGQGMRGADGHPLQGLRREGHGDAGDQPADRDRRGRSLKVLDAKLGFDGNAVYRHPTSPRCATRRRRTPRNSPPPSMT